MQFRLLHTFIATAYFAILVTIYVSTPEEFWRLGVGSILLGLLMCLFVVYMLRLPAHDRTGIQMNKSDPPAFDGQLCLDFAIVWIVGCLFVFGGGYIILATMDDNPLPRNWWIALVASLVLLLGYIPTWKFARAT